MELAIDTSTETAYLVLSSQGEVLAEIAWHAGQNHTVELMPNLVQLLHRNGSSLQYMGGIIVARGPGSFNGLRVGMSVAKGIAMALKIPLVGVSTLEVEALPHAATGLPICPILNAGRGEVATALFQTKKGKWRRLVEEHITSFNGLISGIEERTVFCGEIPEEATAQIRDRLGDKAVFVEEISALRRAQSLAELGWRRLETGDYDHPPTLQPLYLRRPSITISHRRR
ncbi:MAG TPA: tRNA (adenosine(37)-N6)-threonylcarbamoyltransferase complex dimerization subunit type 1 TsaB [Dehalococcoidia bacterium]|nr:tRNA (adenosine(37)-N6)-threonylcarbamoyltransferase complex dimerization subunit type 1 TsaB [Dehalococcoidia bacterium]